MKRIVVLFLTLFAFATVAFAWDPFEWDPYQQNAPHNPAPVNTEAAEAEKPYVLTPDALPDLSKLVMVGETPQHMMVRRPSADGFVVWYEAHLGTSKFWRNEGTNSGDIAADIAAMSYTPLGSDEIVLYQWNAGEGEERATYIAFADGKIFKNLDFRHEILEVKPFANRTRIELYNNDDKVLDSREFTVPGAKPEATGQRKRIPVEGEVFNGIVEPE